MQAAKLISHGDVLPFKLSTPSQQYYHQPKIPGDRTPICLLCLDNCGCLQDDPRVYKSLPKTPNHTPSISQSPTTSKIPCFNANNGKSEYISIRQGPFVMGSTTLGTELKPSTNKEKIIPQFPTSKKQCSISCEQKTVQNRCAANSNQTQVRVGFGEGLVPVGSPRGPLCLHQVAL